MTLPSQCHGVTMMAPADLRCSHSVRESHFMLFVPPTASINMRMMMRVYSLHLVLRVCTDDTSTGKYQWTPHTVTIIISDARSRSCTRIFSIKSLFPWRLGLGRASIPSCLCQVKLQSLISMVSFSGEFHQPFTLLGSPLPKGQSLLRKSPWYKECPLWIHLAEISLKLKIFVCRWKVKWLPGSDLIIVLTAADWNLL